MKNREPDLANMIEVSDFTVKRYKELLNEVITVFKDFLDEKTAIQILQSHGRFKECLEFAEKLKKYEEVILNYLNEKDYKNAVERILLAIESLYGEKVKSTSEEKKAKDQQIISMIDFILKHSKALILNDESKSSSPRRLPPHPQRDVAERSLQPDRQQQENQNRQLPHGTSRYEGHS